MGGKGGSTGGPNLTFSMFIFIIYSSNIQLFSNYISMWTMLGICRWEYTINETCIGHFLCKYYIYNKIKTKLPLLKTTLSYWKRIELPQFLC